MNSGDFVSRADFALAQDTEIESAAEACEESFGHVVALKFQIQLEAGNSRLRDDHFRVGNREAISKENIALQKALGREIFSERAPRKFHARQFFFPVSVVL